MVFFESSKIRKKNTRVFERKKRLKTLGLQSSIIHANERQQVFYSTLIKTKEGGVFFFWVTAFLEGADASFLLWVLRSGFPCLGARKHVFVIKERVNFFEAYTPQKKETQVFGQKSLTP